MEAVTRQEGSPIDRPRPAPASSGFSLIEVLIAIVVLAIGLLSLARLQIVSLKGNQSAYVLSQATLEAYNIIDCMRANRTAASSGSYNIALGVSATGSGSVVQNDLANWKNTLAGILPEGDGAVACAGSTCTVTVQWTGLRTDGTTGNLQVAFASEL